MSLKQIGLALAIDTSSTSLEAFQHLHPTAANTPFSLNLAAGPAEILLLWGINGPFCNGHF
jgi:hypothetical protein